MSDIQLIRVTQIQMVVAKQASKLSRSKLWKIAEELMIPQKELNKLAKEVVGREFGDCSRLSEGENRKVRLYMEGNRRMLADRYRKIVWNTKG